MTTQQKSVHKKSRGRPPGRRYSETIPVRLSPALMKSVDQWALRNGASRSEALRRLIEIAIDVEKDSGKKGGRFRLSKI
jgi:metal-responsive CopG/Arc/MetJ family transcriptional regulator